MKILTRIKTLAKEQLQQGVEPRRLALGLAIAVCIGIFPLFGLATITCLLLGAHFRLNQPFMQAVNYSMGPLQLLLIPVFLRTGEWLFSQKATPFSPVTMFKQFFDSPAVFLEIYGKAATLAVAVWAMSVPLVFCALYFLSKFAFTRVALKMKEPGSRIT